MEFVTPGFLAAGLAVAAPIIVHLLFRRQARKIELGTIRFLQQALRDHAHRRRVRRWLLLALRITAVLLLAMLFARPFLSGSDSDSAGGEWLIAIDQSASMSAKATGKTRFVQAHEAAFELLRTVPEGTALQVAYFDAAGVQVAKAAQLDSSRKLTARGTDYDVPLKWARDILWRSRRSHRRLVLITDLQKAGVRARGLPQFPRDVRVDVIDVGRAVPRNVGVTAVAVPQPEIRPGKPIVVLAEVRNTGTFAARDVPVSLVLNGKEFSETKSQTVTVAAGQREQLRFEVPVSQAGLYQGAVSIPAGDELAFDDQRHLAFDARTADRVLLVNGQPGATVYAAETYFLEMALRLKPPEATAQPITPFDPEVVEYTPDSLPDLKPFSAVILANVPEIGSGDSRVLTTYLHQGGQVIVFGGSELDVDSYQAAAFLPAKVLRIGDLSVSRVQSWDKAHPLLAGLSDPQHGDLRSVSVRRIVELEPRPNTKVLMRDQAERPLLVEGTQGKGRVLFFAMAADRDWGDWPTHRLFVPILHQTLHYATGRLSGTSRVTLIDGAEATGIDDELTRVTVRNPDPRESDVTRVPEAVFRKAYKLPDSQAAKPGEKVPETARPAGTQKPSEIVELVAWILLVVLVVETFLANRTHG